MKRDDITMFIKNRPAETHLRHKTLETPPGAPEHSRMLITARFKGAKQSPFKTGPSMLTLHHLSREEVLKRIFQQVSGSNMYVAFREPREPGYEKSNVIHENELFVHRKTNVPGDNGIKRKVQGSFSSGPFSSITPLLQHPGNKKALHLHHFNPRQKAAGSAGGTGKSPRPHQDDSPLQLNETVPGAPAFMQTGKQTGNMNLDMDHLTDRVYSMLARKMRTEKERRGW
jgi:hypothetical protein